LVTQDATARQYRLAEQVLRNHADGLRLFHDTVAVTIFPLHAGSVLRSVQGLESLAGAMGANAKLLEDLEGPDTPEAPR
jgi:hypothetical protein